MNFLKRSVFWLLSQIKNIKFENIDHDSRLDINKNIFLIATSVGLYVSDGITHKRLVTNLCFGITKDSEFFYVFFKINRDWGGIYQLRFNDKYEIIYSKRVITVSAKVHQIDIFEKKLFVTDTANNSIKIYDLDNFSLQNEIYPNGKLDNGRNSDNYAHINSVFIRGQKIFLMFHNDSTNNGVASAIYVNRMSEFISDSKGELIQNVGSCAHNIYFDGKELHYNDSNNSIFVKGDMQKKLEGLLRGLCLTQKTIFVGSSPFLARKDRDFGDCKIFCLDINSLDIKNVINISNIGQIQDMRIVNKADLSLSESVNYSVTL